MGIVNNVLAGASGNQGYFLSRSLRFRASASAYLSRTPASASNRTVWTWSGWVKRGQLGTYQALFDVYVDTNNASVIDFTDTDNLRLNNLVSGVTRTNKITSAVYRDTSAWYHIVVSSNGATALNLYVNGVQITSWGTNTGPDASNWFFNSTNAHWIGREQYSTSNYYTDGYLTEINFIDGQALTPSSFGQTSPSTGVWEPKKYGGSYGTNGFYLPFTDNSNNTATTIGKDFSGNGNNWTPNNISVNNGFSLVSARYWRYVVGAAVVGHHPRVSRILLTADGVDTTIVTFTSDNCADSGTIPTDGTSYSYDFGSAVQVSLAKIYSTYGGGSRSSLYTVQYSSDNTNWTTLFNGTMASNACGIFAGSGGYGSAGATYDSMTDVPTLTSPTAANYCVMNPLSSRSGAGTALSNANLTQSGTSDKIFAGTIASTSGKFYYEYVVEGTTGAPTIGLANVNTYNMTTGPGETVDSWSIWLQTGETRNNASSGYTLGGFSIGDILQVAWDVDAGRVWFGKNNTWGNSGNPATATNPAFTNLSGAISPLFKQYASGSFNFGQRPFAYTPPSGFVALNTFNLPTPTIGATASSQANKYMDISLYTGNGASSRTTSGLNFQPDFVWLKGRSTALANGLFNAVTGVNRFLVSNSTGAELVNEVDGYLSAFNSDGFTLSAGTSSNGTFNLNGTTFVGWNWKANGAGVTNTAGSITSTVSANTTAGFSIVTWTGNATNGATVGHGLGVTPNMVIIKNRSAAGSSWLVEHSSISSSIAANSSTLTLTSTNCLLLNLTNGTIGYGFDYQINGSGNALVAYCFAQVAGYSRFGSYTGNGSTDGPFVFTGFRPRYVMIKRTDAAASWTVLDSARNLYNVTDNGLLPNNNAAEYAGGAAGALDLLSNGFKARNTDTILNANGGTYIYMAFAENPFKYSLAR